MGSAPPRQTEIRFIIPGKTLSEQLKISLTAFTEFDFPPLPQTAVDLILTGKDNIVLSMSVITSSQHFVKLGLYLPSPSEETAEQCYTLKENHNRHLVKKLEENIQSNGPDFIEFHYLNQGYGYEVYTEGFDITFHYHVGEECGADVEY